MSIGHNIKAARMRLGYRTQGQFAAALGVPQPQVADWESGRYQSVSVGTLLRIAKALDCSVDVLLFGLDADYDAIVLKDIRDIYPEAVLNA